MSQYPPSPPPFPPPEPLNYAQPVNLRGDLRTIAVRQKAIMFCILAYFVVAIANIAVMASSPPPPAVRIVPALLSGLLALLTLGVAITAAVFVFMLALALYDTGVGILLGILTLIPVVGLIVLLIINSKATNALRQHGIKVGLMGARTSQIPQAGQASIRQIRM
jgi:hypothetical protein